MYKRERIYKSDYDNLDIVYDSWCKIAFYILGVSSWKLLAFFPLPIPF
jgi:hypothetical protein